MPRVAQTGEPAGINELIQQFGTLEDAAYTLNIIALNAEQKLAQVYTQAQEMYSLLNDPARLSDYYYQLERYLGELPQFNQQAQAQAQQPQQAQRPAAPPLPQQGSAQDFAGALNSTPASERWRVLDQMPTDVWRSVNLIN